MPTNEERIQRVKRRALENDFHSGCSQSVLGVLQEEFGTGNKVAHSITRNSPPIF